MGRRRVAFKGFTITSFSVIAVLAFALVGSWIYFLSWPTYPQLQVENAQLRQSLATKSYLVWGAQRSLPASGFAPEQVPDTFDYHDTWFSSAPISVYYISVEQYVQFYNCKSQTNPVKCITGNYTSIGPATSSSDIFKLAEGCADYIALYITYQPTTITPNVTITYAPSDKLTGVCTQSV